jgi:hypothetical protein
MKVCKINQPYGIGDVLLIEPIARYYNNLGYRVDYWVNDEYIWIKDYIDYVNFISISKGYEDNKEKVISENYIYLPLIRKAISPPESWRETGWLYDKYLLANLDPKLWSTYDFKRNKKKEAQLFNMYDLKENEYILINENSSISSRRIDISTDKKIVKMKKVSEYSLLDWCYIIENCAEFHTVSTSSLVVAFKVCKKPIIVYERISRDGSLFSVKKIFCAENIKYEI